MEERNLIFMAEDFLYDVLLSRSAKDKVVVRPLAARLRDAGLRLWFDEWVLPVAASRQSAESSLGGKGTREEDDGALPRRRYADRIDEGLEHSRVLACPAEASERRRMLCMSVNAFARSGRSLTDNVAS